MNHMHSYSHMFTKNVSLLDIDSGTGAGGSCAGDASNTAEMNTDMHEEVMEQQILQPLLLISAHHIFNMNTTQVSSLTIYCCY